MNIERLHSSTSQSRVVAELGELIDALDRRVVHIERAGEMQIAHDATALRDEAVRRIAELMRAGSDAAVYNPREVDAVMTDDGGPALTE